MDFFYTRSFITVLGRMRAKAVFTAMAKMVVGFMDTTAKDVCTVSVNSSGSSTGLEYLVGAAARRSDEELFCEAERGWRRSAPALELPWGSCSSANAASHRAANGLVARGTGAGL